MSSTEANIHLGMVTLTPKAATVFVDYSKMLQVTSTPDIENILRADITNQIAAKIDHAVYHGVSTGPVGLETYSQVRNGEMLRQCHPPFRLNAVKLVLHALEQDGYRPRIQCAFRSVEAQAAVYAAGTSHLRWGFHNATTAEGTPDALAVDMLDDDAPLAPSRRYCLALACAADRFGLQTGVTWGLLPHLKRATLQAIAARVVDADVKIGFDPCHVVVRGVTVAQAKRGDRPVGAMYA